MWMRMIIGSMAGSCMASFVCCMAPRAVTHDRTVHSHCPHCQKRIRRYDLIPIFGYLLQKGRCRYCHHPIPPLSFSMEILFGILGGCRILAYGRRGIVDLCLLSILLYAALYDRLTCEIPDYLHGFGVCLFMISGKTPQNGFVLALAVSLLAYLYGRCRKTIGLGGGDCKLLLWMGLFFTLSQMCVVLLIACCMGMVYCGLQRCPKIAFAPFLLFGVSVLLFLQV